MLNNQLTGKETSELENRLSWGPVFKTARKAKRLRDRRRELRDRDRTIETHAQTQTQTEKERY